MTDFVGGTEGEDRAFVGGLVRIIEESLTRHRPGEPFVYGIHQEISPRMREGVTEHFRRAGWARVTLTETPTGGYLLVLSDRAPGA